MPDPTLSPGTSLPIDPATLGSLSSTLQGLMGQQDIEQKNQLAAVAKQASDAQDEASQAGQQYQQAAQAPAPQLPQGAGLVPGTMGLLASLITGDKSYTDRARSHLEGEQAALAEHRVENLKALSDNFAAKAKAAQSIGNQAMVEQARLKKEGIDTKIKAIQDQMKERHDLIAEKLGQQNANTASRNADTKGQMADISGQLADLKKQAAGATGPDDSLDKEIITTRNGNQFLDTTNIKGPKALNAARQYAASKGIPIADPNSSKDLKTANEVYNGLDQVEETLGKLLPHQTGNPVVDFLSRQAAGARNLGQAISQSGSDAAAFQNTMPLAIRSLQAVAAGPGSGFRLNQAEIQQINKRWPKLNDNIETAQAKLQWERWFLQNKEQSALSKDWRLSAPEPIVPGLPKTNILRAPKVNPPAAAGAGKTAAWTPKTGKVVG